MRELRRPATSWRHHIPVRRICTPVGAIQLPISSGVEEIPAVVGDVEEYGDPANLLEGSDSEAIQLPISSGAEEIPTVTGDVEEYGDSAVGLAADWPDELDAGVHHS